MINIKTPRIRDEKHLAFVRTLPCILTGQYGVDPAHIRYSSADYGKINPGVGKKPDDKWVLPLIRQLHDEQHRGNELSFWRNHGIDDPLKVALRLYEVSGDAEAAEKVLRESRK